jgi:carboxymethylenebutenolidase
MPDDSHQNVTFACNGGNAHCYLAVLDAGSGPGVIVIQEWWGLTEDIKDVTIRFARRASLPWPPTSTAAPPHTTATRPAS